MICSLLVRSFCFKLNIDKNGFHLKKNIIIWEKKASGEVVHPHPVCITSAYWCIWLWFFSPRATSPTPAFISKQVSSFLSRPSTTAWTASETQPLEVEGKAAWLFTNPAKSVISRPYMSQLIAWNSLYGICIKRDLCLSGKGVSKNTT